jgi:hypothetical protein
MSRAQMSDEIDRGYRDGDLVARQPRLVELKADVDDSHIGVGDLAVIQAQVRDWELKAESDPVFLAVFLALSDRMAVMAEIYMALWERHGGGCRLRVSLERSPAAARVAMAALVEEARCAG